MDSKNGTSPELILKHTGGPTVLGPDTLVIALDDTGHEEFADPEFPVFGLGGCAFLVRDYERLIVHPWEFMCRKFFSQIGRPMHAVDIHQPTVLQLDAFRHFFESFEFFRLAVTASTQTLNTSEVDFIRLVGATIFGRIVAVAQRIRFDRAFILVEESDRAGARVMASLAGKVFERGRERIKIELGAIPKSACAPALEVADFIIHTAGAQTRSRIAGDDKVRKDFEIIFRNVDKRLVSFFEITKASIPGIVRST